MLFRNRKYAGQELATSLHPLPGGPGPLVLALARGGVPVAKEVAAALDAPLDVWAVRKVRLPARPDLVLGAVAEGDSVFLNRATIDELALSPKQVQALVDQARVELSTQIAFYREGKPPPKLEGADIILVDDGILTGATARAAIQAIRAQRPRRIVLAIPLGCVSVLDAIRPEVDELVCLHPRRDLSRLNVWFREPEGLTDADIRRLLRAADDQWRHRKRAHARTVTAETREVEGEDEGVSFHGTLTVPAAAQGLVIWVHGFPGHRLNQRNQKVARTLQRGGLATLLIEPRGSLEHRLPDAELDRLFLAARQWARLQPELKLLPAGYLAVGGAAPGALLAAAKQASWVDALVLEEGRLDVPTGRLEQIRAPTLLIVAEGDRTLREGYPVLSQRMTCIRDLVVIPDASYLFAEEGALEEATAAARAWFLRHLGSHRPENTQTPSEFAGPRH